jgi:hypothetical protein
MKWKDLAPTDKIELVKLAWFDGASMSKIAAAIGVSRNVIAGMYSRYRADLIDCPLSINNGSQGRKSRIKPKRVKSKPIQPVIVPQDEFDASKMRLVILKYLGEKECHFPVTEIPGTLYCGLDKKHGSSYCAHHHKVMHRKER